MLKVQQVLDSNSSLQEECKKGAAMRLNEHTYEKFSKVFSYPEHDFLDQVKELKDSIKVCYPEAEKNLDTFIILLEGLEIKELEELYIRTFDVQAVTTLDIGYLLFADDYKRGELLVNLNREHNNAGVDCGIELPDHLSNLLKLLPRINEDETLYELITLIVIPALKKCIKDFSGEKQKMKNRIYKKYHRTIIKKPEKYGGAYKYLLTALLSLIEHDLSVKDNDQFYDKRNFTASIYSELEIEKIK